MWEEVRAAAEVVKHGTVSEAAKALGVHRATVIRRIEALEEHLGGKLFQRHQNGYTPTELSNYILKMAKTADEQMATLRRLAISENGAISGTLIITSTNSLSPTILRYVSEFTAKCPDVDIVYKMTPDRLRLEFAEAHVAFRLQKKPEDLDYVVMPHTPFKLGLFASKLYISNFGMPTKETFHKHRFITMKSTGADIVVESWIEKLTDVAKMALVSNDGYAIQKAIEFGIGIGFYPLEQGLAHPDLIELEPHRPEWYVPTWIVTHVDLHRSAKVQAFLEHCRNS